MLHEVWFLLTFLTPTNLLLLDLLRRVYTTLFLVAGSMLYLRYDNQRTQLESWFCEEKFGLYSSSSHFNLMLWTITLILPMHLKRLFFYKLNLSMRNREGTPSALTGCFGQGVSLDHNGVHNTSPDQVLNLVVLSFRISKIYIYVHIDIKNNMIE